MHLYDENKQTFIVILNKQIDKILIMFCANKLIVNIVVIL